MNQWILNGRMAVRRKAACLLVLLFTAAVTLFLLIYPRFIQNTKRELEFAYDSIQVTGWILNIKDYSDPSLYGQIWHQVLDTGYIGEHDSYSTVRTKVYSKEVLLDRAAGADDGQLLAAMEILLAEEKERSPKDRITTSQARGVSRIQTESELYRQRDSIRWMAGCDESCLTGNQPVCLLSEEQGWQPGDRVPVYLTSSEGGSTTLCLTVAGVYPETISNNLALILPLNTLEEESRWLFCINGFSFTVADNRKLPALKEALVALGLNGMSELEVRAAIDDRVLEGTVAPIQSNLAMLEGLYQFFFIAVIAIGFFLCFLLARGRKPEYAVMRLLGESTARVTCKALLEQMLLCLAGICLGAVLLLMAGQGNPNAATCGIILACYTLGAAVAVLLTVRVNVMEILRDKE